MEHKRFGTDPHKLHRRDAPATSVAAAYSVDSTGDEKVVYELIAAAGARGATLKECARHMGKQNNQISGRFTALLEKGYIEDAGDRRERCRVYKITKSPNPGENFEIPL